MTRFSACAVVFVAFCFGSLAHADKINIEVTHAAGVFRLMFEMDSPLSQEAVYAQLTDYANLSRLNPSIKESKMTGKDSHGNPLVRTRVRGCVAFYCKNMVRVERVVEMPPGLLSMQVLPEHSDFKSGWAEWLLQPTSSGTHIVYRATIEPGFEIPAVVGPWLMRGALVDELEVTMQSLTGGPAENVFEF